MKNKQQNLVDEHLAIYQAIVNRDNEAARDAMMNHWTEVEEIRSTLKKQKNKPNAYN